MDRLIPDDARRAVRSQTAIFNARHPVEEHDGTGGIIVVQVAITGDQHPRLPFIHIDSVEVAQRVIPTIAAAERVWVVGKIIRAQRGRCLEIECRGTATWIRRTEQNTRCDFPADGLEILPTFIRRNAGIFRVGLAVGGREPKRDGSLPQVVEAGGSMCSFLGSGQGR
jgi:hypothetical protein